MNPSGRHRSKARRQAVPSNQNVLSAAGAPPGTFPVIDPFSKKLFIPIESMSDTRAMHREGVPSLCRIFLQGRCRQGANCFQAHADNDTVLRLRAVALAEPSCCPEHGAADESLGLPSNLQLVINNDEGKTLARVPLSRVCVTNGLHTLVVAQGAAASPLSPEVVVPVSALCRLHNGHGGSLCCRFGSECSFVHICREVSKDVNEKNREDGAAILPLHQPPPVAETGGTNDVVNSGARVVDADAAPALPPHQGQQRANIPLEVGVTVTQRMSGPVMGSSVTVPMSVSGGYAGTPTLSFDPLALAATAPSGNAPVPTYPMGMSPVRSFSSTPNGLVWRHNPYGSSKTSSAIET